MELSHHYQGSRQVYKDSCKNYLNLLTSHRERRRAFIARKSKGRHWSTARKAAGVKQTTLQTKSSNSIRLIKPEDLFYPIAVYVRLYGDPAANKSMAIL